MIKKLTLAGIVMISASSLAYAADVTPLPIGSDWTGFYIGAGGGYQWGGFDVDTDSCTNTTCNQDAGEIYSVDLEDSGWFATGQIGFDYQLHDSFVMGAMLDLSGGQELEDSEFNSVDYDGQNLDDGQYWDASLEGMLTLSGRAGFLVTPDALIYGLAGWSWARAEVNAFEGCDYDGSGSTLCGDSDVFADNDDKLNGWTLGAGVEWAFIDNLSARVEYRYTDLGSIEAEGSYQGPDSGGQLYSVSTETDVTVQSVRMTINYRF
jgi:outer membrane immunogenic protein